MDEFVRSHRSQIAGLYERRMADLKRYLAARAITDDERALYQAELSELQAAYNSFMALAYI